MILLAGLLALFCWVSTFSPQASIAQEARKLEGADAPQLQPINLEPDPSATDGETAHDIFAALALAWQNEDHDTLAELVADDGVEIAITPDPKRDTHYSPDQAFYFFKNLFKSSETDTFQYMRQQNQGQGGLVHALVDWSYHRNGDDVVVVERLVIKLTHDADGWGLSEIRAIH
jgi:ketosteroid isomerase-like protein